MRLYVRNDHGEVERWFESLIASEKRHSWTGGLSNIQILDKVYPVKIDDNAGQWFRNYYIEVDDMVMFWLRIKS